MRKSVFILVILCFFSLVTVAGRAQSKPLSQSEQEKRNATFLREGSYASPARIKEFLAMGVKINCADEEGETVLMRAAKYDRVEAVQTLIGLHARVNVRDRSGRTALFYAFMGSGQYNPDPQMVADLLDAGADVNAVSKYGETPLKMALALQSQCSLSLQQYKRPAEILIETLTTDKAALVALLKQRGAWGGLAEAAFSEDNDKFQSLLRGGADIHSVAVTSALETAIRIGDLGVVKRLLAVGADPCARDREGMSLLMQAVGEGRLPIIQELLNQGAVVKVEDKAGLNAVTMVHGTTFLSNLCYGR